MKRTKFSTSFNNRGFIIVEAIVSAFIGVIIFTTFSTMIVSAIKTNGLAKNDLKAQMYLKEAIEVTKDLEKTNWPELTKSSCANMSCYPVANVPFWTLSNTSPGLLEGVYTRSIVVQDVLRDANNKITSSGGIVDPNTKKIIATISWSQGAIARNLTLETYAFNEPTHWVPVKFFAVNGTVKVFASYKYPSQPQKDLFVGVGMFIYKCAAGSDCSKDASWIENQINTITPNADTHINDFLEFGNNLYAAAGAQNNYPGVVLKYNNNDSWTEVFATTPLGSLNSGIFSLGEYNGKIFAGSNGSVIYKSADGLTWSSDNIIGGPSGQANQFLEFKGDLYAAGGADPNSNPGGGSILRYNNGALKWERVTTPSQSFSFYSLVILNNTLFAGGSLSQIGGSPIYELPIYKSSSGDLGTWSDAPYPNASKIKVNKLTKFNSKLYATVNEYDSSHGVWAGQIERYDGLNWVSVKQTCSFSTLEVYNKDSSLFAGTGPNCGAGAPIFNSKTGNQNDWNNTPTNVNPSVLTQINVFHEHTDGFFYAGVNGGSPWSGIILQFNKTN